MTEEPIPFKPKRYVQAAKPYWHGAKLHEEQLMSCTKAQLDLARTFQRLAFTGPENAERWQALGLDSPTFLPVPMYVRQALGCDSNPALHLQLILNLQGVKAP